MERLLGVSRNAARRSGAARLPVIAAAVGVLTSMVAAFLPARNAAEWIR